MKRRTFIKRSSAVTIPVMLGKVNVAALKNPFFQLMNKEDDRVLVLIQMSGGNDGLNMIIPRDQYDNLSQVRSNILIPENKILPISDTVGLHPEMKGIQTIHETGKLNIIQSVAYPNQNRSHFRSTDIWHSGSNAQEIWTTGWLGRYFNLMHPNYPTGYPNETFSDPFAITIGSSVNETCEGVGGNFSTALVDPANLSALATPINPALPDSCFGDKMQFLVNSIVQTNAYNEVIERANSKATNLSNKYADENKLANKLKVVARLIAGGLKTKVYVVDIGGFDTHAEQVSIGDTTTGEHAVLLKELSDAVAAFQDDIEQLGVDQRVIGLTYSEFGRRIRSNDSFGTDHGTAAPMMVFGSCVNSAVLGTNPEIVPDVDKKEGVPMQFDFRSIYGSILVDWMGLEEQTVRDLLFPEFQHLPILNICNTSTALDFLETSKFELTAYPNPFNQFTNIEFTVNAGWVKISLFDVLGSEVKVLTNQKFNKGTHAIKLVGHDLPTGSYYCHIQTDYGQQVQRLISVK